MARTRVDELHLACRELRRCVRELGAVGSFIRPNMVNGRFWHSNYWEPLYTLHEELDVTWGFHEGTGAWYSHMNDLYGENRFYRRVASHWIEMQQALIAMIIGGVFEFWLADGEAPSGIVSNRKIISFNPAVLRVEQVAGTWCLRDDHVVLYNFGPSKADAETALAVCRRYGFNQLGFVGQPTPNLKYLMVDKNAPPPKYGAAPVVPAAARMVGPAGVARR